MAKCLSEDDARTETRNRFRLRRPSPFAEFELRVEDWRLFYRVVGAQAQVVIIGRKQRDVLIVDGKRFIL